MPAMVVDENNETREVVTTNDLRDAQRFWGKLAITILVPLIGTIIIWGNGTTESLHAAIRGHTDDSAAIVQLRVEFIRGFDSSLVLQQQILRAVTAKR